MKDIERTIELMCSICGSKQFQVAHDENIDPNDVEDYVEIKCSDCGRICTKEELFEDNEHVIEANIDDMVEDSMKALQKELDKMFK
jgi:uncharacterized Zn finger protein